MSMTTEQVALARHALGLPNERRRSYRNYFTAGKDHRDYQDWLAMVEEGHATRRENPPGFGGSDIFYLTAGGARAALLPSEKLDPEDFPAR